MVTATVPVNDYVILGKERCGLDCCTAEEVDVFWKTLEGRTVLLLFESSRKYVF
jgi:hypothetical protein